MAFKFKATTKVMAAEFTLPSGACYEIEQDDDGDIQLRESYLSPSDLRPLAHALNLYADALGMPPFDAEAQPKD